MYVKCCPLTFKMLFWKYYTFCIFPYLLEVFLEHITHLIFSPFRGFPGRYCILSGCTSTVGITVGDSIFVALYDKVFWQIDSLLVGSRFGNHAHVLCANKIKMIIFRESDWNIFDGMLRFCCCSWFPYLMYLHVTLQKKKKNSRFPYLIMVSYLVVNLCDKPSFTLLIFHDNSFYWNDIFW